MGMKKNNKKSTASAAAKKSTVGVGEDVTNSSTTTSVVQGGETASTSSTTTTTKVSSSSSQQQTSSSSTSEQVTTSTGDTTQIVEVLDNGKLTAPLSSVEYTVSGPETPNPIVGKVHYVFGGTQISEVSTKDKGNKSDWDGKFTYEKTPVNKNASQVILEHPSGVTTTSTMESHASSSSSSVQKSSSSSYVIEIGADGKERVVDSQSREWGSSAAQSQAETFRAKSGTGIETEVSYAAKEDQAKTKFDSGDGKGQKPIYEHSAVGSEHYLEQVGKKTPIEHSSEHAQNVSYDAKTNKFVTSSGTVDNKAALQNLPSLPGFLKHSTTATGDRKTVIDSTSLQHVDKSASATSIVDQTERFLSEARGSSTRNAALTTENMEIFNTSSSSTTKSSSTTAQKVTSSSSRNVKDVTHSAITEERRGSFDETASNNTFIVEEPFASRNPAVAGTHRTDRNQSNWNGSFVYENANGADKKVDQRKNVIDSTITYTSKVFDAMTNTWRIVDETTVNEKDLMVKNNDHVMKDRSRTVEGSTSRSEDPIERPAAGKPSVRFSPNNSSPAGGKQRTPSPSKRPPQGPKDKNIVSSTTNISSNVDSIDQLDVVNHSSTKTYSSEFKSNISTIPEPVERPAAGKPSVKASPGPGKQRTPSPMKRTPQGPKDTNIVSSTTNTTSNLDSIDQLDVSNYSTTKVSSSEFKSDFSSTINSSTFNQDSITSSTPLPRGPGGKPLTQKTDSIDNLDTVRSTTSRVTNKDLVRDNKSTTTLKDTKTSKRTSQSTNVTTTQVFDEKTKTWREVDEKTLRTKRPSLVRYVSQEDDGTFTTIFKRKVYDSRSGQWNVVDEKVYKDRQPFESIPELSDDVTNTTTTTYTTKVYDTKTGKWTVVDEQKFVDRDTRVPTEIVQEIEKDHADVANITTTTEITKVSWFSCLLLLWLIFRGEMKQ